MMDGKLLLVTNVEGPGRNEIVQRYKSLADIERGFKVLKSEIEIAPVFHRLPERIRAHASICFMALILYRVMRQRLKLAGTRVQARTPGLLDKKRELLPRARRRLGPISEHRIHGVRRHRWNRLRRSCGQVQIEPEGWDTKSRSAVSLDSASRLTNCSTGNLGPHSVGKTSSGTYPMAS
jgi:hypothetical protein